MSRPDGITWSSIPLLKVFCSVLFQSNLFRKRWKNFYTVELVSFSVNPVHKNSGYISWKKHFWTNPKKLIVNKSNWPEANGWKCTKFSDRVESRTNGDRYSPALVKAWFEHLRINPFFKGRRIFWKCFYEVESYFFLVLFQLVHILFYRSMLCLASFTCWLTIPTSSGTTMKLWFNSESKLFLLLIHYYTRL